MNNLIEIPFQINHEHPVFDAHFPGDPILPGALLLQWAIEGILEQFPEWQIKSVNNIKFFNPLRPGQDAMIYCQKEKDSLLIDVSNGIHRFMKGKLRIHEI